MNLNKKAIELEGSGTAFAWATVVNVKGSAPRQAGAKMIITNRETFGTVGGGSLENEVIKDAREQLRLGDAKTSNYPLGPLLGQCCGGEVDIFIEPVLPKRKIVVFGAGHIAEHLLPMLKSMDYIVTLVDERKERIDLPAFAECDRKLNELPSDALKMIDFGDDLHLIVLTHAHLHDEEIVEACLSKPFRYLGLIGSLTKWEKFKSRYKSRGFSDEQIARVTTPIGLDIGGETPFEIAVSIVGELIQINSTPKGFGELKKCPMSQD